MKRIPTHIIIDVDGVMTTGQFIYSNLGKQFKIFVRLRWFEIIK